jgi:hypothetical protein
MRLKPNIHFARPVWGVVRHRTSRSYLLSSYLQTLICFFCCATISDSHSDRYECNVYRIRIYWHSSLWVQITAVCKLSARCEEHYGDQTTILNNTETMHDHRTCKVRLKIQHQLNSIWIKQNTQNPSKETYIYFHFENMQKMTVLWTYFWIHQIRFRQHY